MASIEDALFAWQSGYREAGDFTRRGMSPRYYDKAIKEGYIEREQGLPTGFGVRYQLTEKGKAKIEEAKERAMVYSKEDLEGEFMEYLKGDESVGIGSSNAEQTREYMLKEYPNSRKAIEQIYDDVKKYERKENQFYKKEYQTWKKENPEEYRESVKWRRSYAQKRRWEKLKSNRGQGGYFRHRREHSINARKRRR